MEYVVQAIKVSKNLMQAEANTSGQKLNFTPISVRFLRDYQLILCMLEFLH